MLKHIVDFLILGAQVGVGALVLLELFILLLVGVNGLVLAGLILLHLFVLFLVCGNNLLLALLAVQVGLVDLVGELLVLLGRKGGLFKLRLSGGLGRLGGLLGGFLSRLLSRLSRTGSGAPLL